MFNSAPIKQAHNDSSSKTSHPELGLALERAKSILRTKKLARLDVEPGVSPSGRVGRISEPHKELHEVSSLACLSEYDEETLWDTSNISLSTPKTLTPVYEATPYHLNENIFTDRVHCSLSSQPWCEDESAVLLKDFLSDQECTRLINHSHSFGLTPVSSEGYHPSVRTCDRTCFMAPQSAEKLFQRVKPFLKDIIVRPDGSVDENGLESLRLRPGRWEPIGLNPCFRVVNYQKGGFFQPHFDGGFKVSETHRSIKTFMMYLSAPGMDYSGGATTFYNANQKHYRDPIDAHKIGQLTAQKGACLLMNHHLTHDGSRLESGEKWICRTELMYTLKD